MKLFADDQAFFITKRLNKTTAIQVDGHTIASVEAYKWPGITEH